MAAAVGDDDRKPTVAHALDTTHQVDEIALTLAVLLNLTAPDRVEHRRTRGEVERDVVGNHPALAAGNGAALTRRLDTPVPDLHHELDVAEEVVRPQSRPEDGREVPQVRQVEDESGLWRRHVSAPTSSPSQLCT